jgi:hypothetical protein
MLTIPTTPTPSQTLQTSVANQPLVVNLYQKAQGLFADVVANGVPVTTAVLCLDAVPLVAADYLGLAGNLMFIDTQGSSDPDYTGLGSRFQLVYLTVDEYALIQE